MPANLVLKSRVVLGAKRFADVVIWQLPAPLPGSTHPYKYRLAFVVDKVCVLRYDNEAGKGDQTPGPRRGYLQLQHPGQAGG
jgi:hypothetical protein